jgi:hypothetical protein
MLVGSKTCPPTMDITDPRVPTAKLRDFHLSHVSYIYKNFPPARCVTEANSVSSQLDVFRKQFITLRYHITSRRYYKVL